MRFNRQQTSIFSSWWWTVDRIALMAILFVIFCGAMLVATGSPSVAERIGMESFYFIKRQLFYVTLALIVLFLCSLLSPLTVRRIGVVGFAVGIVILLLVPLIGVEKNGATRWISLGFMSLQPSEFIKPLFILVTAWMLAESQGKGKVGRYKWSFLVYVILASLLITQPDFGMVVVVTAVWGGQLFVAGLPFLWIAILGIGAIIGVIGSYMTFPHVAHRIDSFLTPDKYANYQVQKSLEAFHNGGLVGKGPGEGVVKQYLPDSHTDFIFAVAGEELGALVCLMIVLAYGFIVIRGMRRLYQETDLFTVYAVAGFLMQFGIQAIINMGVALNILPTKGMTLPFISYGGSSMLGLSMTMGMMLALTRRRFGNVLVKPKVYL